MSDPSQAWRGAAGGLPGSGPPLPAPGKFASRQILLRAASGEPHAGHPWVLGAPRARGSVGLRCRGAAGLPPTQGAWFGSETRCRGSAPGSICGGKRQPRMGAGGPQADRLGAAGLCPVPGQRRQPRALSSPPRLGRTLGCLCKPSLRLTAELGLFSPPAPPA